MCLALAAWLEADAGVAAGSLSQSGQTFPASLRKLAEVGRLPAPPKYTSADFLKPGYWRLRGGLDVPRERFFTVPDPQAPALEVPGRLGDLQADHLGHPQ